jgi:hypothetical protein
MLGGVPCHHGMAHPQVADGGDSLKFWRVAANMLNVAASRQGGPTGGGWAWNLKKPPTWTDSLDNDLGEKENGHEILVPGI